MLKLIDFTDTKLLFVKVVDRSYISIYSNKHDPVKCVSNLTTSSVLINKKIKIQQQEGIGYYHK